MVTTTLQQGYFSRPVGPQQAAPHQQQICRAWICPTRQAPRSRKSQARGIGKDAAEGWLDLAKLVSSSGGPKSAFEDLAYEIGRDVYMDMNGWHLYLRDITAGKGLKLHQALAQQIELAEDLLDVEWLGKAEFLLDLLLGMEAKTLQRQSQLEDLLKKVPVSLGGGKMQVSLYDVLPSAGVRDLQRIIEDFARNG